MEIDDDELERRMRAKLFAEAPRKAGGLSHEEELVAEKLMGKENARRIANAQPGRRVRITPVVVRYEYYWSRHLNMQFGGWRIERIVNGVREPYRDVFDEDEMDEVLRELRRNNQTVVEVRMDGDAPKPSSKPSRRGKEALGWLRMFRG